MMKREVPTDADATGEYLGANKRHRAGANDAPSEDGDDSTDGGPENGTEVAQVCLTSMPLDLLANCVGYHGPGAFRYIGGTCKSLKSAQLAAFLYSEGRKTYGSVIVRNESTLGLWMDEVNIKAKKRINKVGEWASFYGKQEMVELLMGRYDMNVDRGWVRRAAEGGHIPLITWLSEFTGGEWSYDGGELFEACVEGACMGQHLNVLKFAFERNRRYGQRKHFSRGDSHEIARHLGNIGTTGNKEMLAWCIKNYLRLDSIAICAGAAGNVEVLQILHNKGKIFAPRHDEDCIGILVCEASKNGHVNVLEWVEEKGYMNNRQLGWHIYQYYYSPGNIRWGEGRLTYRPDISAVQGGSIDCLEWVLEKNGFQFDAETCAEAAKCGSLDMLKFLRSHGCPWDLRVRRNASGEQKEEIRQWLNENGCPRREKRLPC